ncbi:hypothetical protein C8F04DRAFT_1172994 [Mycena alexandri]|uniref:Uncharacterized protein n=1 Tax=Mycena alexandri TaxID=1745969 RepID=A0AAD6TG73_9AGAR|nr:hypothetical protein C8F04DRAFT_1172994 [Mycena alexandri]
MYLTRWAIPGEPYPLAFLPNWLMPEPTYVFVADGRYYWAQYGDLKRIEGPFTSHDEFLRRLGEDKCMYEQGQRFQICLTSISPLVCGILMSALPFHIDTTSIYQILSIPAPNTLDKVALFSPPTTQAAGGRGYILGSSVEKEGSVADGPHLHGMGEPRDSAGADSKGVGKAQSRMVRTCTEYDTLVRFKRGPFMREDSFFLQSKGNTRIVRTCTDWEEHDVEYSVGIIQAHTAGIGPTANHFFSFPKPTNLLSVEEEGPVADGNARSIRALAHGGQADIFFMKDKHLLHARARGLSFEVEEPRRSANQTTELLYRRRDKSLEDRQEKNMGYHNPTSIVQIARAPAKLSEELPVASLVLRDAVKPLRTRAGDPTVARFSSPTFEQARGPRFAEDLTASGGQVRFGNRFGVRALKAKIEPEPNPNLFAPFRRNFLQISVLEVHAPTECRLCQSSPDAPYDLLVRFRFGVREIPEPKAAFEFGVREKRA